MTFGLLSAIVLCSLVGIVWLYIAARAVTRAITRTLDERRSPRHGTSKED